MLTRCPQCQTAFRVTSEQLKARQGQVRCGSCRMVFDALDSLADEMVAVPAGTSVAYVPDSPEAPATEHDAAETSLTPAIEMPEFAVEPAQPEVPESEPPSGPTEEPSPANWVGDESVPALAELGAPDAISAEIAAPELPEASAEPSGDAGEENRLPQDGEPAAGTDAEPPGEPGVTLAEEPLPEAWEGVSAKPPGSRWPWRVGTLLLAVLALLQLVFVFRVELAVIMPELRPALEAGCDVAGCTLPRPRKPELASIESSDLAPAPDNRLQLTAVLRNRAPFDQECPHLELTLTDTNDRALLRRVLAPADYLPANRSAGDGFPARGELAVKLLLEAPGVPAAGYRLYLFFP